jgi:hypothetical protein
MSKVSAARRSQIAKMGGEKSAAVRESRPPRIIPESLKRLPRKSSTCIWATSLVARP